MAHIDHRQKPTKFPGDGTSPHAIIDREWNYYGEDFYFYSGGVLTSARTLIGGGVPPNIVLQNTGGFTAGRVPFANANGYALVDDDGLKYNPVGSNNGTGTLIALNLAVNPGSVAGEGDVAINSTSLLINQNNFALPTLAGADQYKLLWVGTATKDIQITPYTMPPTAGVAGPVLTSNGLNYINSTTFNVPNALPAGARYLMVSNGAAGETTYTPYRVPGGGPAGAGHIIISTGLTDSGWSGYSIPTVAGADNTFIKSSGGNFVTSTYALPASGSPITYAPIISDVAVGTSIFAPYGLPNAAPGAAGLVLTSTNATDSAWSAPAAPQMPVHINGLMYHDLNVGSIFSAPYGVWIFGNDGANFTNSTNSGSGTVDYYFQGIDTTAGGTTWTVQPIIEQSAGANNGGLTYDIRLSIAGGAYNLLGAGGIVPTSANQQPTNQRTLPSTITANQLCDLRLTFTEGAATGPHSIRIICISIWRSA